MGRIDRREFAKEASLAFLSGVTVTVSACGGGGGAGSSDSAPTASSTPAPPGPEDEVGEISANHGHQAIITAAQLMAGGALQVDIAGTAGHSHIVSLPAQAVEAVRNARPVQTDSTSTDAHSHTVTFNAESPEPPERY
jgi:hypothetical protein